MNQQPASSILSLFHDPLVSVGQLYDRKAFFHQRAERRRLQTQCRFVRPIFRSPAFAQWGTDREIWWPQTMISCQTKLREPC